MLWEMSCSLPKMLRNMSTGIAPLLTLISYTQNPTGWVHATGNYLSAERGLSNLRTPESQTLPSSNVHYSLASFDTVIACIYCQWLRLLSALQHRQRRYKISSYNEHAMLEPNQLKGVRGCAMCHDLRWRFLLQSLLDLTVRHRENRIKHVSLINEGVY